MKKIKFMDCSFRDGFQSCIGARAKTEDFAPALEAAAKAGINHIEIGGGARFQSLFFYTQENAFEEMDKWRQIVGPDVNLQTLSRGVKGDLRHPRPRYFCAAAPLFAYVHRISFFALFVNTKGQKDRRPERILPI